MVITFCVCACVFGYVMDVHKTWFQVYECEELKVTIRDDKRIIYHLVYTIGRGFVCPQHINMYVVIVIPEFLTWLCKNERFVENRLFLIVQRQQVIYLMAWGLIWF